MPPTDEKTPSGASIVTLELWGDSIVDEFAPPGMLSKLSTAKLPSQPHQQWFPLLCKSTCVQGYPSQPNTERKNKGADRLSAGDQENTLLSKSNEIIYLG